MKHSSNKIRVITKPAYRDQRKYSDVLLGRNPVTPREEEKGKIIPVYFTLNAVENSEIVMMLENAIIAENKSVIDLKQAQSAIVAMVPGIKGVFSLSPTKISIAFDSKNEAEKAVAVMYGLKRAYVPLVCVQRT